MLGLCVPLCAQAAPEARRLAGAGDLGPEASPWQAAAHEAAFGIDGPALRRLEAGAPERAAVLRAEVPARRAARFRESWGLGLLALALGTTCLVAGRGLLRPRVAPLWAGAGFGLAGLLAQIGGAPGGPWFLVGGAATTLLHAGASAIEFRGLGRRGRALTAAVVISGVAGASMAVLARLGGALVR